MPNTKFQIFVSSTYQDLKEERDQVIKACLEMGHIPVGMEMFNAADEEQWTIIKRQIDESDYYVVLVAHRYGSMLNGKSFTEREYEYAVRQGVPVLGFVIDPSAPWPNDRYETDEEKRKRLADFVKKAKRKPVDFWTTRDDLHAKCAISLMKAFSTRPRPGWVRTSDVAGPEVTVELSRLSKENATLREEIAVLRSSMINDSFSQGADKVSLSLTFMHGGKPHDFNVETTWNEVFFVVAKTATETPIENAIRSRVTYALAADESSILHIEKMVGIYDRKSTDDIYLKGEDFVLIKTQLIALNYITVEYVSYNRDMLGISTSGYETIWKLTENGMKAYGEIAALRRKHVRS